MRKSKKRALIFSLLLSSIFIIQLIGPAFGEGSAKITVSLNGTISYPLPQGYISETGNRFYDNNGKEVTFFGAVYYHAAYSAERMSAPCEADFQKMASQGFNLARLTLSWKMLEPEKGQFNQTYLIEIDHMIGWCKKYAMYALLDLHTCNSTAWDPDWAGSVSDFWNPDTLQELFNVWATLSNRYNNETTVLGYSILCNELSFTNKSSSYYSNISQNGFFSSWNNWLETKYDSIEAYNSTLTSRYSTRGQLKSDETSWEKIRFPDSVRFDTGFEYDSRMASFYSWWAELYFNITQKAVETIRLHDQNHLIVAEQIMSPWGDMDHRSPTVYNLPDGVNVTTFHCYTALNEGWFTAPTKNGYEALSSNSYSYSSQYALNNRPIIATEIGNPTKEEQFKPFLLANLLNFFADSNVRGICIINWRKNAPTSDKYYIVDSNGDLLPQFSYIPYIAKLWKESSSDENVQAAIIQPVMYSNPMDAWYVGEGLYQLHVPYRIITDTEVAENPDVLNSYKLVFVIPWAINSEAINSLIEYKQTEGHHIFIAGRQFYNSSYQVVGEDITYELGLTTKKAIESGDSVLDDTIYTLQVANVWGDFNVGEKFDYQTGQEHHYEYMPLRSELANDTKVILSRTDQNQQPALFGNDQVVAFFDNNDQLWTPTSVAEYNWSRIVRAACVWTGVNFDVITSPNVLTRQSGEYLFAFETNHTSGSVRISLDVPLGTYLFTDITNGSSFYKSFTAFPEEIDIILQPNSYVIFQISAQST